MAGSIIIETRINNNNNNEFYQFLYNVVFWPFRHIIGIFFVHASPNLHAEGEWSKSIKIPRWSDSVKQSFLTWVTYRMKGIISVLQRTASIRFDPRM